MEEELVGDNQVRVVDVRVIFDFQLKGLQDPLQYQNTPKPVWPDQMRPSPIFPLDETYYHDFCLNRMPSEWKPSESNMLAVYGHPQHSSPVYPSPQLWDLKEQYQGDPIYSFQDQHPTLPTDSPFFDDGDWTLAEAPISQLVSNHIFHDSVPLSTFVPEAIEDEIPQSQGINLQEEAKSQVVDDQKSDKKVRVRKDAIWKDLLREFRKGLQRCFAEHGFSKGLDHWSEAKLVSQVQSFLGFLQINKQDDTPRNLMGLILLLRTCAHKNPPKKLKKFIPEVKPLYWKVFNNNNDSQLKNFFKEKLIQQLWPLFTRDYLSESLAVLDSTSQKLMRKDFSKYNLDWP